jgi:DNA integrity scanning protein DisA with diadenylate cyclase activity
MPEVTWLLSKLTDPRSIIDILVVTIIVFWVLWVAQGTRATQVLRGAIILLALAYVLATTFSLTTLDWILHRLYPALLFAIPVIFQPEIRRALEQLGHTGTWLRNIPATDAAIQERTDGDRARNRASGLRGPRRADRCLPDPPALDQHFLPE